MRPMNFGRLLKKLTTEKDQVEFLQERGILKQQIDCVGCLKKLTKLYCEKSNIFVSAALIAKRKFQLGQTLS